MEDFHRQVSFRKLSDQSRLYERITQEVAAACLFLATKTEECGRKLRDVAKVSYAKSSNTDPKDIPTDCKVGYFFV